MGWEGRLRITFEIFEISESIGIIFVSLRFFTTSLLSAGVLTQNL